MVSDTTYNIRVCYVSRLIVLYNTGTETNPEDWSNLTNLPVEYGQNHGITMTRKHGGTSNTKQKKRK